MSTDVYASHLPVLRWLGMSRKVRRVLELGPGRYSTGTFLNDLFFENLELLVSVENDRKWYEEIDLEHGEDRRLLLRLVNEPIEGYLKEILPGPPYFDLIMIDNSISANRREATIRFVGKVMANRPVTVVVHDAEYPQYLAAIRDSFQHHMIYESGLMSDSGKELLSQTAVAWNEGKWL